MSKQFNIVKNILEQIHSTKDSKRSELIRIKSALIDAHIEFELTAKREIDNEAEEGVSQCRIGGNGFILTIPGIIKLSFSNAECCDGGTVLETISESVL